MNNDIKIGGHWVHFEIILRDNNYFIEKKWMHFVIGTILWRYAWIFQPLPVGEGYSTVNPKLVKGDYRKWVGELLHSL